MREMETTGRTRVVTQSGYGFFHGGDPRKFHPDSECSSPEEIAAHEITCAQWDAGNQVEAPAEEHGPWVRDGEMVLGDRPEGEGWRGVCVRRESYGLGSYEYEMDDAEYICHLCKQSFWGSVGEWDTPSDSLVCRKCAL